MLYQIQNPGPIPALIFSTSGLKQMFQFQAVVKQMLWQ